MSKRKPYELAPAADAAPLFWRSLEEKADPSRLAAAAVEEFPRSPVTKAMDTLGGDVGRRGFLFGGLSTALLAVEGCARRPVETILPYTRAPEYALPGMPLHFATVRAQRGDAVGLVVESHEGRPTKVEGNPDHPTSQGAADVHAQASLLDLYDPDRSTSPTSDGTPASWEQVDASLKDLVAKHAADGGAKLRVLAEPTNSPTWVRLRDALLAKLPQAHVHTWAPVSDSNGREGARLAFGQPLNVVYDYAGARVILTLDADILQTESGVLRATRSFAASRRLRQPTDTMSRLYSVEPALTPTGAAADHRLRLAARDVERYALSLAKELGSRGVDLGPLAAVAAKATAPEGVKSAWLAAVAADLADHRGRSVVVVGSRQPARVHALAAAINAALSDGSIVRYFPVTDPSELDSTKDLASLVAALDGGKVDTLIVLGGNPVYDAPADLAFGEKMAKAATTIHLSDRLDETSRKAKWHLPRAHELETWGDQRALDGTVSIQQPLIAPLRNGRSDIELLGALVGEGGNGYALVRGSLKGGVTNPLAFEAQWKLALNKGLFAATTGRPLAVAAPQSVDVAAAFNGAPAAAPLGPDNLEVAFAPDPKLFDGRYANNPWLLEVPDSLTRIVWDNAALLSPATAKALGVEGGDIVTLARDGAGTLDIPVWILPGTADNVVALTLGWGRKAAGRYGNDVGVDVYPFRRSDALGFASGVKLSKTGKNHHIVQTQEHNSMEGRPIAIDATLDEYRATPNFAQFRSPSSKTLPLWTPVDYSKGHKWGMSIDLSACTGCNACVIACQSENNVATVGKEQVYKNREMHWLRVDRYFVGENENEPSVVSQPLMCVQCEEAPCENVCPVNATAHSPEGLNDMAYNRCIGTRYCANNCPYKVRRFNYLEFQGGPPGSSPDTLYGDLPEERKMQFNPDVTVRMRGVMEKCTYCVQRIQEGKIASKREHRAIRDGEITTACAQTCAADAIVFGDLNDPNSRVARLAEVDRGYKLLAEIGTRPRTTYLGKIRNPNPDMKELG